MNIVNIGNRSRTIYLFCRDQQGKQVIQKAEDFFPFFYEPDSNGPFMSYDGVKLKKVVCSIPSDVNKRKSSLSYASDIRYTTLYLIEKIDKITPCPIRKLYIDIEVENADVFPDPNFANYVINCVTTYDNFNKQYKTFFIDNYKGNRNQQEKALLNEFIESIKENHPDLLCGWNFSDFDYPYLYNRLKQKGIDFSKEISPISSTRMGNRNFKEVYYPNGISIVDLMGLYKKYTLKKKRSYALDYIGQEDLGYEAWDINKKGFSKEKNIKDVEKIVKLDEKFGIIDYFNIVRMISKCQWEDLPMEVIKTDFGFREQSNNSKIVDCLLLQEAKKKNVILPSKRYDNFSGEDNEGATNEIQGAFREAFETGLLHDITKYDLSSAYPACIKDFNLDIANLRNEHEINSNCIKIDLRDRETNEYIRTLYYEQNPDAITPSLIRNFIGIKDILKKELNALNVNTEEYKKAETKYNAIKSIINSCFTSNHNIITSNGIKNIKDIKIGDIVYNVNPQTLQIELDEVIETQELDYEGYLYSYKNGCDLKVTNDHRFLLSGSNHKFERGTIFFKSAQEIYERVHKYKRKDSCPWYIPKVKPIANYETPPTNYEKDPFTNVIENFYDSLMEGNNRLKIIAHKWNPSYKASNDYKTFSKKNFTREEYKGKVYCLTTKKNKTIFAGRNNTFALVGQCYGVIGNSYYRLFSEKVANTITFLARDLILYTKEELDKQKKEVIYADTDSIFAKTKENIKDNLNNIVKSWGNKYNNPHVSVKYDYEGIFESIIIFSKCIYYGKITSSKGTKIEKKGLQLVKSSSSKYEAKFQKELLDKVLDGVSREDIIKWINNQKDIIRQLPLEEVAFPSKLPNKKLLNNPIHWRAYNNTRTLNDQFTLKSGDLFYYIFINSLGKMDKDKDLDVLAFTNDNKDIVQLDRIDWQKVIDRNINNKSNTLFEVLKWKSKKAPMLINTLNL